MKKRTLRRWLIATIPLNIIIFVAAVVDYIWWDSRAMVAILTVYALLLVGIIILLTMHATPAFRRLRLHEGPRGPKTIIYGKR